MNFVTFEQLNACIYRNMTKLPKDIDLVVGVPRSGLLVANLIALYLNLPFTDIDSFCDGRMFKTGKTRKCAKWAQSMDEVHKVLIVDDSISKGDAIKEAKEKLKGVYEDKQYTFCAVYALPTNTSQVDVYFEICNHPRMFEWNYLHHWGLNYACVDFENIIYENDSAKVIPTQTIQHIISVRPESMRQETEQWLNEQGVLFDELVLKPETVEETDVVQWKAEFYKKSDSVIYLCAHEEEAPFICSHAGKQVFCLESRKLIMPEHAMELLRMKTKDTAITAKRVVQKLLHKI